MSRVALDTNVLVYAELEPDSEKGQRSLNLIRRAAGNGVIPVQVLGEFLRVVQRKLPSAFAEAARQANDYRHVFLTPPTTDVAMAEAAQIALANGLQLWDAVVCAAAAGAGASLLLTEDLQDGQRLGGLLFLNPFLAKNAAQLDAALA